MKSFRTHRKSIERTKLKEDLSDEGILDNPDDLDIFERAGFIEVQSQPTVPHFVGTKSNITTEAVDDITLNQLNDIEKYADRLFAKVGIDVEFTRHFLDRVNDARNKRQITPAELTRLFKQSYKKYGRAISKLGPAAQAVINDMRTDINMPFVLEPKGNVLELVAKTVMRKKDFKTTNTKFSFEQYIKEKRDFFEKDVYEKITLPPPPRNDHREIQKIKDAISTRTSADEESIRLHDEVPFHAIQEYCEKENLEFHIGEFEQLIGQSSEAIMHFKEKFNRKRPWLVDETIRPLNSKTNKTPAYPSGHAAQSILIANYVAGKFPEHKVGLMSAAKKCGWGRVQAGWHYVSDYKVGNQLGEELYKHMNRVSFFSEEALKFDEQLRGLSEDIRIESERDKIAQKEKNEIQSLIEVNEAFNETEEVAADLIQDPFLKWREPVEPDPKSPLDFAGQITGEGHILPEEMTEAFNETEEVAADLIQDPDWFSPFKKEPDPKSPLDFAGQITGEGHILPEELTIVQQLSEELTQLKRNLPNMMATTAGGGEVLIKYMDDIDASAITDGYFMKYRASDQKFIGSASTVSDEAIQDIIGAMVTSNTESGIAVTYQDGDGTLDFTIGTLNQDTTGNAATATALETGRTIGMTGDIVWTSASFDGTGNVTGTSTIQANSVDGTMIALGSDASGDVIYYNGTNYIRLAKGSDDEVLTLASGVPSWAAAGGRTNEEIQDLVGAMFSSNTETGIAATYEDGDGTIDLVVGTLNQDTTGNAATATALETARTIGGTSFDGTANIAVALSATATALASARTIHGVSFDGTANIDLSEEIQDTVGAMFSSNTETGVTVTYEDGDGTIDLVVGTLNQDTTGNAATATALETARTIGGTSFDGTANIAVALAAAATALASARTIGGTSFDGTANIAVALSATATALASARTIHGVSFDGTANIDLTEVVQDTVGAMFGSNTETGITVTYQDGDGTIDLVVGTLNQDTTGTAAKVTVTDSTANTNFPVTFHDESNALLDDTGALRYNPSTGTLLVPNIVVAGTSTQVDTVTMEASNAVIFEGATADDHETTLTIIDPTADRTISLPNATGTIALTSSDITGNAATATALETARTIGGTSFDGTANIAVALSATATALASARTIGGTSFDGTANIAVALAATATALASARTIHGVSFDGTANIDLTEVVQDTVGAMFGSNTETGITVTYEDGDGTIDLVVGTLNQDTSGTAALATSVTVSANNSTNETVYPVFVDGATGTQGAETDTGLSYNPSTGVLTTTSVTGNLTGNVTGNTSGTAATVTTAAQTNITSLGTLTALQVDNININGNTISSTGGTDLLITPLSGQQIVLDGTIVVDAGVVTGATSITSTAFVGDITGDVTGNAATATILETARTIGGTSFNGSANIAVALSATATALASARTIGGTSFDGTANIAVALSATATALATGRTIGMTGDVVWTSPSFDGSGNVTAAATIQANSVDGTMIALGSDASGDVMYYNGTNYIRLAKGSDDEVLTLASGVPSWATAGGTSDETIQDVVGAMFTSNTETGIAATYQDGDGTIDLVVGTLNQDTSGTAAIATTVTITDNESTNESNAIIFTAGGDVDGGNLGLESDGTLTYNPSTGKITATGFVGTLTGNVTGDVTGSSGSTTGNAATATALATARTIGGTSFDGTANIAVALAATATALASARTIGGVSFDGTANINLPGVNASGSQDTSGTAALATSFTASANNSTNETVYPVFVDGATGTQGAETDTGLTYNPSTGLLTSTGFSGNLTGTLQTAAQGNVTSVGALDGGTITSGFGAIDNGTSGIRTATFTAETAFVPDASDGATLGTASLEFSDLYLADGGIIYFGDDQEITLTHVADDGLILKHVGTGDGKEPSLTFQAGDNDIAADDVLGSIFFQAPNEGAGTDAILVAAGIEAVSEGDFSSSNNATSLVFKTGASETATAKVKITSAGHLIPAADDTHDLGTSSIEWRNAYFDGTVTSDAFAGPLTGNATTATALATGRTIGMTGDVVWTSASFDGSGNVTGSSVIQSGAVETGMIAADAITAAKIGDNVLNSEHYAAGSIDNEHLAANSVDSDNYVDDSIDTAHYAAGSVDATALGADCVTAAKIGDNVLNSEHYAAGSIDAEHMAANSIDSDSYVDGSIDRVHLAADIIDGTKIADDVINSEHYAADSIDAEHYAPGSVDATAIGNDVVNSQHYAADSIDEEHLANDCVGSAELKSLSTLLIKNSGGSTLKTVHGAGA